MSGLSFSKSAMMPSHRAWVPSLYDGTSSSMVLPSPSSPSSSPNPQPAAARLRATSAAPVRSALFFTIPPLPARRSARV